MSQRELPLGKKAYTKIPHLPGSRTGSADRVAPAALAARCTLESQPGDDVVVQEKLDGSCVGVTLKAGEVIALGREGWRASESQNPGRQMFGRWVGVHAVRFRAVLREGEWLVGEWLALVHSTRYRLSHEPFVVFDLFSNDVAVSTDVLDARLAGGFARPHLLHRGAAIDVAAVDSLLGEHGHHGSLDAVEGAMWRIERAGEVVTRAKFVRGGKVDGVYLPENSGQPAVWNWTDQ
jgi:RNA ligase